MALLPCVEVLPSSGATCESETRTCVDKTCQDTHGFVDELDYPLLDRRGAGDECSLRGFQADVAYLLSIMVHYIRCYI